METRANYVLIGAFVFIAAAALMLFTDRRGDVYGGALGALESRTIPAGGLAGKGVVARVRGLADLARGLLQARRLLKALAPRAVVGFGGYASVPTVLAATAAGIRTVVHEQNAVLGRANRLLAGRARVVALTLGREGALVATRDRREIVPVVAVEAVDASGAGDCFDGAFLVEYVRTADPFAAARYACVAAALSTRGLGAVAPIPRRAEVEAKIARSAGS